MTPGEVPAYLEAIKARVARSAPAMALAMGREHERYLTGVTLLVSGSHGPATAAGYPPAAARGAPPATMTGRLPGLRGSIRCVMGASGGVVASSVVSANTIYAPTQEFGEIHTGNMWLWVHYVGPRVVVEKGWRKRSVDIGPHPYMRPSRDAVLENGTAVGAANAAFMAQVWG